MVSPVVGVYVSVSSALHRSCWQERYSPLLSALLLPTATSPPALNPHPQDLPHGGCLCRVSAISLRIGQGFSVLSVDVLPPVHSPHQLPREYFFTENNVKGLFSVLRK
jgi:hypothetical protein